MFSQPFWNPLLIGGPAESFIGKDNSPVILDMPYNSTDGLVYRSCSLLVVPIFTWELSHFDWKAGVSDFAIEIVFLQNDLCITNLRVRDANDNDAPRSVVWEVQTLTDPASADAHQNRTTALLFKDGTVVPVHDDFVLRWVLGLS